MFESTEREVKSITKLTEASGKIFENTTQNSYKTVLKITKSVLKYKFSGGRLPI